MEHSFKFMSFFLNFYNWFRFAFSKFASGLGLYVGLYYFFLDNLSKRGECFGFVMFDCSNFQNRFSILLF